MVPTRLETARIAEYLVSLRERGEHEWTEFGHFWEFELAQGETGKCARWVRMLVESAMGLPDYGWEYKAGSARAVERKLAQAGLKVPTLNRGDLIFWDYPPYGHGAVLLGPDAVAENTSHNSRGLPSKRGSKITPLAAFGDRPYRVYSVLPQLAIAGPDNRIILCNPVLIGNTTWVDQDKLAHALGFEKPKDRVPLRYVVPSQFKVDASALGSRGLIRVLTA